MSLIDCTHPGVGPPGAEWHWAGANTTLLLSWPDAPYLHVPVPSFVTFYLLTAQRPCLHCMKTIFQRLY